MAGGDIQVQQVRDATDIIRLVSEQLTLKPKGKEWVGLCPFHNDKSPSLNVSPTKQIYKCYACGAGGDVFGFVMNYHKMTFVESLKYLAERANIKLESKFNRKEAENTSGVSRTQIYEANAQAVGFYRALLNSEEHGKTAREYIAKRKISPEMVEAFQLGYGPDRWDGLVLMIKSKKWNLAAFEQAGLIGTKNNGVSHFDKLRHRIIFPIIDVTGRPIAFGGRKIRAEDEPKYLNSPETPVFNKSQTLYGLHLAKKPIQDGRTAVIVEGYTDVIACHQAGVRNVVATLGTALTLQHVKHLRHFCDRVILIYDGDAAGLNASDKAVSVFLEGELDVYIAVIPGGEDPADLFERPEGLDIWHKAIKDARDALSYQFERVKQKLHGADTITGRQKVAEEYLSKLVEMGVMTMSPMRKVMIEQRVGELLGLTPGDVDALLKRLAQAARPRPLAQAEPVPGGMPEGQGTSFTQVPNNGPMVVPDIEEGVGFEEPSAHELAEHSSASDRAIEKTGELTVQEAWKLLPMHRQQALLKAERLMIGCLLAQNELFHGQVLSDGRMVDESIGAYDLVDGLNQKLYEMIYDQLAEGQAVGIGSMLTLLASQDAHMLAGRLTQIEDEVHKGSMDKPENVRALYMDVTTMLVAFRQEREKKSSGGFVPTGETGPKITPDMGVASRKIAEARESMASAQAPKIRIARIGKQRFT